MANIPAFADAYLIDGTQPVYLYKKAFFLLEAFARRLSAAGAPSTACLPMFVDNVLPTVLVHARVLDLSSASPALRKWGADPDAKGEEKNQPGPQLRKEDAYAVRAAALDAGTQMVKRAKELAEEEGRGWMASMTEADLGECCPVLTAPARLTRHHSTPRRLPVGRGQGRPGAAARATHGRARHGHVLNKTSVYNSESWDWVVTCFPGSFACR